ncbi:MAG: SMI1/KNR4 family protein [Pyrinomonadaceae bacterium]
MKIMEQRTKTGIWRSEVPASESAIQQLLIDCCLPLPAAYLNQLRHSNGGEGDIGIEPGWVSFWKVEEMMELNRGFEVAENIPGFFGFGSNGGGEMLAFKVVDSGQFPIYMIPFTIMSEEDAVLIAEDFAAFREAIGCV